LFRDVAIVVVLCGWFEPEHKLPKVLRRYEWGGAIRRFVSFEKKKKKKKALLSSRFYRLFQLLDWCYCYSGIVKTNKKATHVTVEQAREIGKQKTKLEHDPRQVVTVPDKLVS
jgi:hypothetical protein